MRNEYYDNYQQRFKLFKNSLKQTNELYKNENHLKPMRYNATQKNILKKKRRKYRFKNNSLKLFPI